MLCIMVTHGVTIISLWEIMVVRSTTIIINLFCYILVFVSFIIKKDM